MKRKLCLGLLVLLLIALLPGCVAPGGEITWTPETQLLASRAVFNEVVNALASLRETGYIGDDEAQAIGYLVAVGAATLDLWYDAIQREYPTAKLVQEFNRIIGGLVAARIEAEGRVVQ